MSAYNIRIIGSSEVIEEHNQVQFRLLYSGELKASGNNNRRGDNKHAIRQSFNPQLRRLWNINPNLRQLACGGMFCVSEFAPLPDGQLNTNPTEQERFEAGLRREGRCWNRAGYNFVPLVTEDMVLRCSLDILLLRPGDQKHIYRQGDIDGQLKTLFDALRIPANAAEMGGDSVVPGEDENPFFCLLEDDRLITEVHVVTDELLLLPNHKEVKANDSFVIIDVKLNHKDARTFNNYFG